MTSTTATAGKNGSSTGARTIHSPEDERCTANSGRSDCQHTVTYSHELARSPDLSAVATQRMHNGGVAKAGRDLRQFSRTELTRHKIANVFPSVRMFPVESVRANFPAP
jgi:hypothetical protein